MSNTFSASLSRLLALATGLLSSSATLRAEPASAELMIAADKPGAEISRDIYGQFSEHLGRCIYEGIWVGEDSSISNTRGIRNDVVEALKRLRVPVLRWPGGCFADEYHWKDGVGPREKRPSIYNSHWGGVVENNHFGTHEFMDLCEQVGCDAYICGNVGSGSVQEMMEWVEYLTSDADSPMANLRRQNGREKPWIVKYFGVGNESWGCGGNMTPEFYADNFRRYNTFVKDYDRGHRLYRIACGANAADYNWTEVLMKNVGRRMNGLSLHYYTLPTGDWRDKGSATEFGETQWYSTLQRCLEMEELVSRHSAIMDRTDPQNRVGLIVDEWGAWFNVEPGTNPGFLYQQSTLRDALVAGITLNVFNRHANRVKMANIAQMVNVLQAMILTDKERMILTPTYHVFEMYRAHHDAKSLPVELQCSNYQLGDDKIPSVSVSASRDEAGAMHVTLCNLHAAEPARVTCTITGMKAASVSGRVLTASEMNAHNTFEKPDVVRPSTFEDAKLTGSGFAATLPPKSVVALELK